MRRPRWIRSSTSNSSQKAQRLVVGRLWLSVRLKVGLSPFFGWSYCAADGLVHRAGKPLVRPSAANGVTIGGGRRAAAWTRA